MCKNQEDEQFETKRICAQSAGKETIMKTINNTKIIGIDHGYGNMKTANCCFTTGVSAYDKEPTFKENLLVWDGQYYLIGEEHKEFAAEKMLDDDYYVLTLAAVARELNIAKIYSADVYIAAGLPLTWVGEQKEEFKKYLLKNKTVDFNFKGKDYHIRIVGADVFAQGYAAIVNNIKELSGMNMLCDIGNGTMNVMNIIDKKVNNRTCFTEKYGTQQCVLAVREQMMRQHHASVDDSIITRVLRFGTADIDEQYLNTIRKTATEYVEQIFRKLREHEYDPRLMRLYVVGGGGCLIKNFGSYDESRVVINDDICATAKGYERMAELKLLRSGGKV